MTTANILSLQSSIASTLVTFKTPAYSTGGAAAVLIRGAGGASNAGTATFTYIDVSVAAITYALNPQPMKDEIYR